MHYECNRPFVTMEEVDRRVDISPDGEVTVTDHYSLLHSGAALKGPFSRFDYQRNQKANTALNHHLTLNAAPDRIGPWCQCVPGPHRAAPSAR